MVYLSSLMNERGNISIELALGFSLFVSLLIPAILEYSEITRASRQLENYLSVLGRGWSIAELDDAEVTLRSLRIALSKDRPFDMNYSCSPGCLEPDAKLTFRLTMSLDSILVPKLKAKGTFARDYFSR